jgi:hypothetical protein
MNQGLTVRYITADTMRKLHNDQDCKWPNKDSGEVQIVEPETLMQGRESSVWELNDVFQSVVFLTTSAPSCSAYTALHALSSILTVFIVYRGVLSLMWIINTNFNTIFKYL